MSKSEHIFSLMNNVFLGFILALFYGCIGAAFSFYFLGVDGLTGFVRSYFKDFNCAISGGLIFCTAILVYKTQNWIPDLIEKTFGDFVKSNNEYIENRRRFFSAARTISFSSSFFVVGLVVFSICKFPNKGAPHYFLLVYACIQYALGVYVGRKLFYLAQMIHSISDIDVDGDLFIDDKLSLIPTYINSLTTLTTLFVYIHVYSYYQGPFLFGTPVGDSMKIVLALPAVLAAPVVVIFNFYPRAVLRGLYSKSICKKLEEIKMAIGEACTSPLEREMYLIEYDKMSREELKHRLRVSLSDLPVAVASIMAILAVIFH